MKFLSRNCLNFLIFLLIFLFNTQKILAQKESFIVNINPVRGSDFWSLSDQKPNDFVEFQKKISDKKPITWLLRPDYFLNTKDNLFLNSKYKSDEIGIFLEVTPVWTNPINIKYNSSLPWYHSQNIFLSGYNPKDRIRLIDYAFLNFKNVYGYYPKSVGAWHIDPVSAQYLVDKYHVNSFLICTDQTSTDGYQIWGGWWGIPYYPSKDNLLVPAQSSKDKLDALILWWAARDPVNGYGQGKNSLYSVQPNDYLQKNLDINYFQKLVNIYLNQTNNNFGEITIGLENDNSLKVHGSEYQKQIKYLSDINSKFVTATDFYDWYSNSFPNLSPDNETTGTDPLGSNIEFRWLSSKQSRIGLIKKPGEDWQLIDYRLYTDKNPDPYQYYKNLDNALYWNIPAKIDSVFNIGQTQVWKNQILIESKKFNFKPIFIVSAIIVIIVLIMNFLKKIKLLPTLLILLGTFILSLTMIRSGSIYPYGMGFWGPNGHDGIWHLSLINQLQNSIPPKNPVYGGTYLSNYHWGFDLFAAFIGKVLPLSNVFIYFKLLPVLFALGIGLLSYLLAKTVTKNKVVALSFVALNYFAGSFGYLITLFKDKTIGGESLFWSMQSASTLLNPPYALSLVVMLFGLLFWYKNKDSKKIYPAVINGIIFGILAGIKVYAGILIGLTIVTYWLFNFIKTKKFFNYHFYAWVSTAIVSLSILVALGALQNSTLLEYKPLWFTHSMIESIDKFYFPRLASLRMNLAQNPLSVKLPILIAIEITLIGIFLIGNMGMRIFGFWTIFSKVIKKQLSNFDSLLIILMLFAFLIPQLFVQKGTAWNTIQFFYYFLFVSNFFFAQFIANILNNKNTKSYLITAFIFLLAIPTSYSTIKDYLGNPPPSAIPPKELEAVNFLKNRPTGAVLTYPYDKYKLNQLNLNTPIPMYLYETTAYVSAMTNHQTFLEDEMNLDITGFDWKSRKNEVDKFFNTTDKFFARGFLINNNISYIYLVNDQNFQLSTEDLQINKIFDNSQVRIYQVRK
jgi:hypothetical protein